MFPDKNQWGLETMNDLVRYFGLTFDREKEKKDRNIFKKLREKLKKAAVVKEYEELGHPYQRKHQNQKALISTTVSFYY
jgi:hypothetical protein